jgi:hypothetical protein
MRRFARVLTLAAVTASIALAGAGCEASRDEMRPDMDKVISGEQGLQSRDLREMTNQMAPDLLQIREIVANPNRIVVTIRPPKNMTESERGRDMTIYVARLKALLNSSASRDRIAFIEDAETLRQYQAQELGGSDPYGDAGRTQGAPDRRVRPQYVLTGEIYEKNEGRTRYYLCTFHLTDIVTGVQVWEKPYEVRTLN